MDIITLLIISSFLIIAIFKIKNEKNGFFDLDYTTTWKGICSIIVIFVHIPPGYGNKIQSIIHSFGYVCVTLFFLFSGYGLKWSLENKKNYLDNFIINRMPSLLFPFITMNILSTFVRIILNQDVHNNVLLTFLGLNGFSFVHVLLLFYISFYIIYNYVEVANIPKDLIMYFVVIVYSSLGGFFDFGFGWHVEALGFLYGIVCCNFMKKIDQAIVDRYILKTFFIFIISLFLGVSYLLFKSVEIYGNYLLRIFLGLSIIILFLFVTRKVRINNQFTKFLGKISYEIFLSHGFIMMLISFVVVDFLEISIISGVYISLTIFFTIIFSSILQYFNSRLINLIRA
ncbi:MAG: acyltransferase family protein [Sulfuricella sp.]|jgi:peptidoglycan/LPS O-acetylase OafA/YrhL